MKLYKKILTLLLLLLLLVVGGAFAVHAEDGSTDTNNRKLVRVGYLIHSGYQEGGPNRPKTGYGYEYLQRVAYEANWNYEYVYDTFSGLLKKLETGEIDLMGNLTYTPARAEQILFGSKPQGKEKFYIYANLKNNPNFTGGNPNSLNGKRVGVAADTFQEQLVKQWAAEKGVSLTILNYSTAKERETALDSGQLDLDVAVGISNKQASTLNVEPIVYLGSNNFYFGVSKLRPDLLDDLNRAQEAILNQNPAYNDEIYAKYKVVNLSDKMLGQRELDWLRAHKIIRMGYLRDYMPYCTSDSKTGKLIGLLKDYEKNMEQGYAEHSLRFANVEYVSYKDMLDALKKGEIDAIFPSAGYHWLAERVPVAITDSLVTDSMVLIYKNKLDSNTLKLIGVEKGSTFQPYYVQMHYPDARVVEFEDLEDCINAVKNGEVGCMVYDTSNYRVDYYKFKGLKANNLYEPVDVSFATNVKDMGLNALLNKGISMMGRERINASLVTASAMEHSFDWERYVVEHTAEVNTIVCFFAMIGLGLFAFYHYSNKRHQSALEEANDNLRHQSETIEALASTYIALGCVDLQAATYRYYCGHTVFDWYTKGEVVPMSVMLERFRGIASLADYHSVFSFAQFDNLQEKLKNANYVSLDYRNRKSNWCRLEFIVSKRNGEVVEQVLAGVRFIDDEKARERELSQVKRQLEKQRVEGMALQYKAEHDGLTDLLNRTAFEDVRSQLLDVDEPVGLMLVDVDKFKEINDTYGHEAGDRVLIKLANLLRASFRVEDMIFRIGGDEMAVIFLNVNAEQCKFIDDKVRGINAKMAVSLDGEPRASISAGTYISQCGFPEYMYSGADEALYNVKRNGRGGSKVYIGDNDVVELETASEAAEAEDGVDTVATQSATEAEANETDKSTK